MKHVFPACKYQFFQQLDDVSLWLAESDSAKKMEVCHSLRKTEVSQIDLNATCTSAEEFAHDFSASNIFRLRCHWRSYV